MTDQVKDKELIPSKFGLTDTAINLVKLKSSVLNNLNGKSPNVKAACQYLIDQACAGKETFPINKFKLTDKEFNIVKKDFGEISGAAFILSRCKLYNSVKFPTGNEKLIDYIMVRKDGLEEKFSAKAGQGGKPSITSLMPAILNMEKSPNISDKLRKAITVIKLVSTEEKNGLYLGPLKAAKFLQTPGYKALIKVLTELKVYSGSDVPSSDQLEQAVVKTVTYQKMKTKFSAFFADCKYTLNEQTTQRLYETPRAGKEKIWGILHYPITAELIKWLNTPTNGALDVLTAAATTLTVNQIYLDEDKQNLKYTVKSFSKANFQFGSPSSMPRPTNNRIGFTMVKEKKQKDGVPDH